MIIFIETTFVVCLVLLSIEDVRHMIIPPLFHVVFLLLGVLNVAAGRLEFQDAAAGAFILSVPMLILSLGRIEIFGGGDIKLCASAGFVLGIRDAAIGSMLGLTLAGLSAFVILLHGILSGRQTYSIPLAPFLSAGFMTVHYGLI